MYALSEDEISSLKPLFAQFSLPDLEKEWYWNLPPIEEYIYIYKRREYRKGGQPVDYSKFLVQFHYHQEKEGNCEREVAVRFNLYHDSTRSLVLTYDECPLGIVGFDPRVLRSSRRQALVVNQIQGMRYKGSTVEGPARSVLWQPALLNLVVVFGSVFGAEEVDVIPYNKNKWSRVKYNENGNADRIYDGTASNCGFLYNKRRQLWVRKLHV